MRIFSKRIFSLFFVLLFIFLFLLILVFFILTYFIDSDEEVVWHLFLYNLFKYFHREFNYFVRLRGKNIRKSWCSYWYRLQFKRSLKFRRWLFIKLFSLFYTVMLIIIMLLLAYFFFNFYCINYFVFLIWMGFFIKILFYYFVIIYIFYLLLLSLFFTNIDYRIFFSFFSSFYGYIVGVFDSYLLSKSFISVRRASNRNPSLKFDPLYLSTRYLGFVYFVRKNPVWRRYWFTFKSARFWNRYYIPLWWINFNNYVYDELMYTDFYKFKQFLLYYWCIIIDKYVPRYLFGDLNFIIDKRDIRLSKFYITNLNNKFK